MMVPIYRLFDALNRRHPFSTFRHAVEQLGVLQDWYAYKRKAYAAIAEELLAFYKVDFEDGRIVCKEKGNTREFFKPQFIRSCQPANRGL